MMNPKPHYSIRLDPALKKALERIAAADGRSWAGLVHWILEQWVKAQKAGK